MIKLNFSRELRLLTPTQFKNVFEQPFRASTPEITILARKNNLEHPRLGLTVAKKHLKRAHDRNRIKRLVRESFRLSQHNLPSCDFVFVVSLIIKRFYKLWINYGHVTFVWHKNPHRFN